LVKGTQSRTINLDGHQPVIARCRYRKLPFTRLLSWDFDPKRGGPSQACEFRHRGHRKDAACREIDGCRFTRGFKRPLSDNKNLRLIGQTCQARSIGYAGWTNVLNRWLSRDGTIGERLILENQRKSRDANARACQQFYGPNADTGVCFALDNFGARLHRYPPTKRLCFLIS